MGWPLSPPGRDPIPTAPPAPSPASAAPPLPRRGPPRSAGSSPPLPATVSRQAHKAALAKRHGPPKPREDPISEHGGDGGGEEAERPLDKRFGCRKSFGSRYELGKEVGRGYFGHTCTARVKKGDMKGKIVAVKIINKAKRAFQWLYEYRGIAKKLPLHYCEKGLRKKPSLMGAHHKYLSTIGRSPVRCRWITSRRSDRR